MIDKILLKKDIGKRVTKIREQKMHMTKIQFSNLIGMKNQYLGAVEKGEKGLTVEKAIEISEKCSISCDYLLRGLKRAPSQALLKKYSTNEIYKAFEIMKEMLSFMK